MLAFDMRCANRLLAGVPDEDGLRWQSGLELVTLSAGQSLHERGGQLGHVVFPVTAIVALHANTENGAMSELALVGCEGMVGISSFMRNGRLQIEEIGTVYALPHRGGIAGPVILWLCTRYR